MEVYFLLIANLNIDFYRVVIQFGNKALRIRRKVNNFANSARYNVLSAIVAGECGRIQDRAPVGQFHVALHRLLRTFRRELP